MDFDNLFKDQDGEEYGTEDDDGIYISLMSNIKEQPISHITDQPISQIKKTKKELAVELYNREKRNGNSLKRKDILLLLLTELKMTPAGASTYYAMIKEK